MPRAVITNPVTYENFTRPVALSYIRDLARVLRLPGDLDVTFAGATEQIANPGSTLDTINGDVGFGHNTKIRVEVQERPVEDRILTIESHEINHHPIFCDPTTGVVITPVYALHEMMIQFRVRFASRVEAQRFRDDALMRVGHLRYESNHHINYHYSPPTRYMYLLQEIHRLRENQGGYGEDFRTWFNKYMDPRYTILSNLAGKKAMLAIPENQTRIWGAISDLTATFEQAEKDKESGTWLITFDYRIQHDKPIACRAEWPLVVHSQFISAPWFDDPEASGIVPGNHWELHQRPSLLQAGFDHIAKDEGLSCRCTAKPAIIPVMDDWSSRNLLPDTVPFAQVLVGVNPDDLRIVLPMAELDEYDWDPDVLKFMVSEAPYMTTYGQSIFHVMFYRGRTVQDPATLSVDSNLVLRSSNPLNVRELHHVRLAYVTDLDFLSPSARQRLAAAGEAGVKVLRHMQLLMRTWAYIPRVTGNIISMADIRQISADLNAHKRPFNGGATGLMKTAGTYTIITRRGTSNVDSASSNPAADNQPSAGDRDGSSAVVSRCDC